VSKIQAEYIWMDGGGVDEKREDPWQKLRSKTKIIDEADMGNPPEWGFDGSSTNQADGHNSDCGLRPVRVISDPIRGDKNILVMCEVLDAEGNPHRSNTRARLASIAKKYETHEPLFGMEQEYTLYDIKTDRPLGWPVKEGQFPYSQGRFYCGVGCDEIVGRPIIEAHTKACLDAGLMICGTNSEVMLGQWEFQVGPLGPLDVSDELWLMRWLLYRIAEDHGVYVKLNPKPEAGDWNGAGMHTNFSTKAMRAPGGLEEIMKAMPKLERDHLAHIKVYGECNEQRLTGRHETCALNVFKFGVGDRGAAVRIPRGVNTKGYGYFERRTPAANADPYKVATALLETVCGAGFKPEKFGW